MNHVYSTSPLPLWFEVIGTVILPTKGDTENRRDRERSRGRTGNSGPPCPVTGSSRLTRGQRYVVLLSRQSRRVPTHRTRGLRARPVGGDCTVTIVVPKVPPTESPRVSRSGPCTDRSLSSTPREGWGRVDGWVGSRGRKSTRDHEDSLNTSPLREEPFPSRSRILLESRTRFRSSTVSPFITRLKMVHPVHSRLSPHPPSFSRVPVVESSFCRPSTRGPVLYRRIG